MDNHYRLLLMVPLLLILIIISFTLLFFAALYTRRRHSPPLITTLQNLKSLTSTPHHHHHNNTSLLLEILPETNKNYQESENKKKKKKKKRVKQKTQRSDSVKENEDFMCCLYPFTSSSSATQRRIKRHYHQLLNSHSHGLTLLQVGQFVNCLVEARNELKHKSEVIHRKFTITKALLFKADRSSFDRLHQQIYKLELEQKRLEEDAFVYNWLQQQLKLSPAYKKMLEIGAYMETEAKSVEATEDISDISFEELLAKEKKDSFWQKKGKIKCGSG